MNNLILGDFDFIPSHLPAEGGLNIMINPIDLMTSWKRCGALANFVASFYSDERDLSKELDANLISTIFNELMENAAKYSDKRDALITVNTKLYNNILKMEVENYARKRHFNSLREHFEKLVNAKDLDDLYIQQMQQNIDNEQDSGIGLLLLLKDYPIKIGIRFEEIDDGMYKITVQVYHFIEST